MEAIVPERLEGPRREDFIFFVCDFSDLFDIDGRPLGVSRNVRHTIENGVARPLCQRLYRVSSSEYETIQNLVDTTDVYPMPKIDNALDPLRGARYFS